MTLRIDNGPDQQSGAPGNPFRAIPSIAELCDAARSRGISLAEPWLIASVREEVARSRAELASGNLLSREEITTRVVDSVAALERPRLAPVLNATGVIVHTNLGRAQVSPQVAQAMTAAAASAVPLEIEPETNLRGGRMDEVAALLRVLTGCEAALVVNNCAAAVLLVLSALASGREVVVSRGEAIEIGGGFRIPDVLRQSGSRLVEVGTTNRTYARDFTDATTSETAAYLKVHPSNFRVTGFTHAPTRRELAQLAQDHQLTLLEDLGSGALLDAAQFGLGPEPTLQDAISGGAHLAMASGDKLLGGPQAGIILGREELVQLVASHPLARAVRADKVTLAGVAETLRHYLRGDATQHIPVWRMIAAEPDAIRARATAASARLRQLGVEAEVARSLATVGGGSMPGESLESWALALTPGPKDGVDQLARRLRVGTDAPSSSGVYGRIEAGRVLLELRTVLPEHDAVLIETVAAL